MFSKIQTGFLILFFLLSLAQASRAGRPLPERILWQKHPIPVALPVGQERLVYFPVDVRYWLPQALEGAVSILAANGVLYIQAHRAFEPKRIRVQGLDTQTLYLLDLHATPEQTATHDLIVMDKAHIENPHSRQAQKESASNSETTLSKKPKKTDWPIRLLRHAAQSLYAPERLLPADSQITRVPLEREKPVALIAGGSLEAMPLNSWRGGGLFVTAVQVRNIGQHSIYLHLAQFNSAPNAGDNTYNNAHLDIFLNKQLRGRWLAVSCQHSDLSAEGTRKDRTVIYLVSRRPFLEALHG